MVGHNLWLNLILNGLFTLLLLKKTLHHKKDDSNQVKIVLFPILFLAGKAIFQNFQFTEKKFEKNEHFPKKEQLQWFLLQSLNVSFLSSF